MKMVYKYNVIRDLGYLASEEFQRIAWFDNDQGLCSSYYDDVSAVFNDTGLEDALNDGEIVFGSVPDNALRDLNNTADAIGYKRDERELIDSADMRVVRQKAANALRLILENTGAAATVQLRARIYIPILNKPELSRDAIAEELPNGFFRILKPMYDYPKDEIWKYNVGDVVRCEHTQEMDAGGNFIIRAVEKVA